MLKAAANRHSVNCLTMSTMLRLTICVAALAIALVLAAAAGAGDFTDLHWSTSGPGWKGTRVTVDNPDSSQASISSGGRFLPHLCVCRQRQRRLVADSDRRDSRIQGSRGTVMRPRPGVAGALLLHRDRAARAVPLLRAHRSHLEHKPPSVGGLGKPRGLAFVSRRRGDGGHLH